MTRKKASGAPEDKEVMNLEDEIVALDKADRDIEAAHRRIAQQRVTVKKLEEMRGDVATATTLLHTLEETLSAMEEHRVLIMARILKLRSEQR
jgi:hypothetical protein